MIPRLFRVFGDAVREASRPAGWRRLRAIAHRIGHLAHGCTVCDGGGAALVR
jgi:hypothetical protein